MPTIPAMPQTRPASDPSRWAVGTSTSLFGLCEPEHLRESRAAGLQCVEIILFGGDRDATTPQGQAIFRRLAAEAGALGLDVWSVHLPFGRKWDIAGPDADQRAWALARQTELLALGAELGAKVAVIHPSAEPIAPADRADHFRRGKEGLDRLTEVAVRAGIRLAAECLPRTCLGNTSAEVLALLEGNDELGVCFDSNHLLQETPQAFVAKVGTRIVTVHISDYDAVDEKHWLPGRGVIDWGAVVGELAAVGYPGPFMFEVGNKRDAERRVGPADLTGAWREIQGRRAAQG